MRTDIVSDTLWDEVKGLLPEPPAPPKGGRPRVPDRPCLPALVYLLREGCTYRGLPCPELGCGSGATVWRRLQEWTRAGVWERLHATLLHHLGRAGEVDISTVIADRASVRAVKGGPIPDPTRPTVGSKGRSGMY